MHFYTALTNIASKVKLNVMFFSEYLRKRKSELKVCIWYKSYIFFMDRVYCNV